MIVLLACIVGFCLGKFIVQVIVFMILLLVLAAKLLQKSEMRKDIVIELSYKGFG